MQKFCSLLSITAVCSLLLSSCNSFTKLKEAKLRKTNHLMAFSALNNTDELQDENFLKAYVSDDRVRVKIREENDGLTISAQDKEEVEGLGTDESKFKIKFYSKVKKTANVTDAKKGVNPPNFFFNTSDIKKFEKSLNDGVRYSQTRPYVQIMTMAVKFRKKIEEDKSSNLPAVPPQIESGSGVATLAIAGGFKQSWVNFKGSKNALGFTAVTHSIAGGLLVGLSAADLKAATTRGKITGSNFETKNLTIPVGVHAVYGFNNINIGFALGQDIILGHNRTEWNYFGKWWKGIIIGLDIIK